MFPPSCYGLLVCYGISVTLGKSLNTVSHRHLRGTVEQPVALGPPPEGGAIHAWGKAQSIPQYLFVLNGYPKKHNLLTHQAEALLSGRGNITLDNIILTSQEDTLLSASPLLKTSKMQTMHFCSPPSCNNAEGDGKFLAASMLANATRHGFEWLLLGDDDTTFFAEDVERALSRYNFSEPHYLAMQVDRNGWGPREMPPQYRDALSRCPPLGKPKKLRLVSYDPHHDISESRGDCNPESFRHDHWFQWAYGGKGLILSAGLLDRIPTVTWQKCIDRITSFGGDVRIAMCLALLGHRVELLRGPANEKLSDHKLSEEALGRIAQAAHQ